MKVIICIDDTDTLETRGTGHLAEILRNDIESLFEARTSRITRHQLYVSDSIPYTSHNSAMCFTADMRISKVDELIRYSGEFLEENSADGSDPGLCVAVRDRIEKTDSLIKFGINATRKVLTKNEAYRLADRLGIHLSEHGGTGGGVIGALSGAGLRLHGNNGRFKGWLDVKDEDRVITVERLIDEYDIDEVRDIYGFAPEPLDKIRLDEKIKTVLLDGRSVLPVKFRELDSLYRSNLSREEIRCF